VAGADFGDGNLCMGTFVMGCLVGGMTFASPAPKNVHIGMFCSSTCSFFCCCGWLWQVCLFCYCLFCCCLFCYCLFCYCSLCFHPVILPGLSIVIGNSPRDSPHGDDPPSPFGRRRGVGRFRVIIIIIIIVRIISFSCCLWEMFDLGIFVWGALYKMVARLLIWRHDPCRTTRLRTVTIHTDDGAIVRSGLRFHSL
jgi:hypothetical protein